MFRKITLFALLIGLISSSSLPAQDLVLGKKKSEWIDILQSDKDAKRRRAAVIALGIFGANGEDVDRVLAEALSSDNSEAVRSQVLQVVRNLKREQLGKWPNRLGQVLKYEKVASIRASAAKILGSMEELAKPVLSNLIASCKDADPATRAAAVEALGKIGADARAAIPEMLALLKDADNTVRFTTVTALGRMGVLGHAAIPDLLLLLASEMDLELRKEIIRVFGTFGDASGMAVEALVKLVEEDPSDEIRQQAVVALGKIGEASRNQISKLKSCYLKEKEKTTKLYLLRTMSSILGQEAPTLTSDFAKYLGTEKDTDLKLALIQELASFGPAAKEALPALRSCLEDASVKVRQEAKAAIERINKN